MQVRREFPSQLSRGCFRSHNFMIRLIRAARYGTDPYRQEGPIDDDGDDGTVSGMSWMSRMTQDKGL